MTKMTIEELKGKGREELAQLKKDGKIGWNELLLSSYELFPETYLEWLDGDEPCEEAAEEFLSSDCSDSDCALETLYYFTEYLQPMSISPPFLILTGLKPYIKTGLTEGSRPRRTQRSL